MVCAMQIVYVPAVLSILVEHKTLTMMLVFVLVVECAHLCLYYTFSWPI